MTRHLPARPLARTRRWAINGRFLGQPVTGVQRYAREVVAALDRALAAGHPLARDLALEIVAPAGAGADLALAAIPVRRVGGARGHLWEQVVLPAQVSRGLLSFCNTGPLATRRQILCVHDANPRLCPESYAARFRLLHLTLVPALGRRVAEVTTVSRFSAAMLAAHGIRARERITVIPNGHEHARRWTPRHSAATRRAAGPDTVVVLGSPARHKNVGIVLGLADELAAAGLRVAVVGAADPRVFGRTAWSRDQPNVLWLGRLDDDALAALLQDCLCLAFPSLTEGFGLPPLEAMALGCPVVVSDRASLPELCADAALYAPPGRAEAWLAAFVRLRGDEGLRRRLVAAGRARADAFRWSEAAASYLALIAATETPPSQAERSSAG